MALQYMTGGDQLKPTAEQLHKESIVINALDSTHIEEFGVEHYENMARGGVTAVNKTVALRENFLEAMSGLARWYAEIGVVGWDRFRVVLNGADVLACKRDGHVGLILGTQNSKLVDDNLANLDILHRVGIRIVQLSYNRRNSAANGCAEEKDEGLSRFGKDLVSALNDKNIVVDLSHVGHRSAMEAATISRAPVIASHSSMRSLCDNWRNIRDELVQAIAEREGVVGIAALSNFLRDDAHERGSAVEDYLDHVDYAVKLVGWEHVGVGLDIGHGRTQEHIDQIMRVYPEFKFPRRENYWAREIQQIDGFPHITAGLVRRGYTPEQVRGVVGGNFLRVFQAVWG